VTDRPDDDEYYEQDRTGLSRSSSRRPEGGRRGYDDRVAGSRLSQASARAPAAASAARMSSAAAHCGSWLPLAPRAWVVVLEEVHEHSRSWG
jgi:hypothetical protein